MPIKRFEHETFLNLPQAQMAQLVRESGTQVCVFPFNGTRRWHLLEYGRDDKSQTNKNYSEHTSRGYISTYKLVFDQGLETIVAPVFGGEIMDRGEEYMREIGNGLTLMATHPAFIDFYESYDIRVHFYGDYRRQLAPTPYSSAFCDAFDEITRKTAHHTQRRLFYGICADDATTTIADFAIEHFQATGKSPTRRDLIERYYGEYIERADLFIGFEKFIIFDYPMLNWGGESLYHTVAPSLYLTESQFREILFDHLYLRPTQDPDYFTMPVEDFEAMRKFYEINRDVTFGVGEMRGGIWYAKSGMKE